MSIMTVESRVTYASLMGKSKSDMAHLTLWLMESGDKDRQKAKYLLLESEQALLDCVEAMQVMVEAFQRENQNEAAKIFIEAIGFAQEKIERIKSYTDHTCPDCMGHENDCQSCGGTGFTRKKESVNA